MKRNRLICIHICSSSGYISDAKALHVDNNKMFFTFYYGAEVILLLVNDVFFFPSIDFDLKKLKIIHYSIILSVTTSPFVTYQILIYCVPIPYAH